eukprot:TRINITY_DN81608_c0_g1_i1.p1 TRINITY_DN81608_c0_g1~~TRINITY_DN81608_c0_g1_i1.p1  ORF type:complete len:456 (+),score=61.32 TRINITY_DN81608_c0_g1_i1:169-1536(+)
MPGGNHLQSGLLLLANLYFDSSVPLWQQLYKDSRVAASTWTLPACEPLNVILVRALEGGGDATVPTNDTEANGTDVEDEAEEDAAQHGATTVDDDDLGNIVTKHEEHGCPWFIERMRRSDGTWSYVRKPQVFTKGAALGIQASCGMMMYYCYNYYQGGIDQLKLCFHLPSILKFSAAGAFFGFSAVFAFLAQDALSPGSYALYAQSGIIAVPVMWRIIFNTSMGALAWLHIVLIGVGIFTYRMSEIGGSGGADTSIGVFWVVMKVLVAGTGSVVAELLLKSDSKVPFTVQVSYILPSKALCCFSTIWLLPPHGLPDRPGGLLHDWSLLTVLIIFHNLGDTVMSALIAKTFDSVVKAICGVVGIIFPTWAISYIVGWEKLDVSTSEGKLKSVGGLIVVISSMAYVFGKSTMARLKKAESDLTELTQRAGEIERAESEMEIPQRTRNSVFTRSIVAN